VVKKNVVFATFSTWVTPTVAINRGEAWDADDPVVLSHPDWFTSDPSQFARTSSASYGEPAVEQATAAPGEKRTVRRAAP
jgi:hypothetical protein